MELLSQIVYWTAYSSMMIAPKDDADLHRIAYNHAMEVVIAMNTPFRVKIALTPNSSCTDGRTVSVATNVFDDRTLTPEPSDEDGPDDFDDGIEGNSKR